VSGAAAGPQADGRGPKLLNPDRLQNLKRQLEHERAGAPASAGAEPNAQENRVPGDESDGLHRPHAFNPNAPARAAGAASAHSA